MDLHLSGRFRIISIMIDTLTNDAVVPSIKAIAEPIRIRILLVLGEQEACVCELMELFGMAQSKLSHHLITLRDAGFLEDDKRGKWNYYRINPRVLTPVNRELLAVLSRLLTDDATIERDRKKLESVKERMQICC